MSTAVLLSGGVDSSVALRLLREAGHDDITAFYLKVWLEDELSFLGSCPWDEDVGYAREVCEALGVPLEIVPMQREYWDRVVSYTIAELEVGRTPSPDIFCNQLIKFGAFLDDVGASFDRVGTGHYARVEEARVEEARVEEARVEEARVEEARGAFRLLKGVDPVKDQTYFLSYLDQSQLSRCLFPIGGLPKGEVRELAARHGLPNRDRPDSQGICFLGKIRFEEFVEHHLGTRVGEIRERETDRVLGEHRGFWFHTIGQRRGLGLSQGPWYVVEKDLERNIVYVSHTERLADHRRSEFEIGPPHWIAGAPTGARLSLKLRHGERVHVCRLDLDGDDGGHVTLEGGDAGIAPGQFAVFYEDDVCLGAAPIER